MHNPPLKIVIYLLLVMIGVALALYGFQAEERIGEAWKSTGVGVVGFTTAVLCFVMLINAIVLTRGRAKLIGGRDVIARWHVSADEWERFKITDRTRAEQDPGLANDLTIPEDRQDRGVDVIMGAKSAVVGDSYHVLRKGGIPGLTGINWLGAPVDPECLEFHVVYPRHESQPLRLTLRIPFPDVARGGARQVYDHFEPKLRYRPPIAFRNPALTIKIALGLALTCGVAAAWGFWRANTGHSDDVVALFAAVAGTLIAPVALLFALLTAKLHLGNAGK